jgi:hypothetical protein
MAKPEASVVTIKDFVKSGYCKMGSVQSADWAKTFCWASFHSKMMSFLRSFVRGWAIFEKFELTIISG